MGMPVTVDVRDEARAEDIDGIFADLRFIDETFSPFKDTSAVSRINKGTLRDDEAAPVVAEVLDLCRRYEGITQGYFDAWHLGRLDPSGLVKGWALARAARSLEARGYANYFVDGAGDVVTRGCSRGDEPWRVGIRHPIERDKVACVLRVRDLAVATSGTYEKGPHIYDPHTGLPATALVSFSVIGPDIVAADVLATACFAMGLEGLPFVEQQDGYQAYAITPDLRAHWTRGFDALRA